LNILFWDIDGTLMRTAKAGLYAFEQATQEQWDAAINFDNINSAGMTDYYIGEQIIKKLTGRKPLAAEIAALTKRYEQLLPNYLAQKDGRVMPAVFDILDALVQRKYFDVPNSAFCDDQVKRGDIAQAALQTLKTLYGSTDALKIFVIGDTPHDIHCGKEIAAYTIGVATGRYSLAELQVHAPWWAVESLPAADEFIAKITAI